jgi:Amt family ammonium transporter
MAVGVTIVYSFAVTAILLVVLDKTLGLRVEEDSERGGLDVSQHGENGYNL